MPSGPSSFPEMFKRFNDLMWGRAAANRRVPSAPIAVLERPTPSSESRAGNAAARLAMPRGPMRLEVRLSHRKLVRNGSAKACQVDDRL